MSEIASEEKMKENISPLKLPLGDLNSEIIFNNPEEFSEIIEEEKKFWISLSNSFRTAEEKNIYNSIYTNIAFGFIKSLEDILSLWLDEIDSVESLESLESNILNLKESLINIDYPFTFRFVGKKIVEVKSASPKVALYMFYYSCYPKYNMTNEYQKVINLLSITAINKKLTAIQVTYQNHDLERMSANRILSNVEFFAGDKDKLELRKRITDLETELFKVKDEFKESEKEFEEWKRKEKEKYSDWFGEVKNDSKRRAINYLKKALRRKNGYVKSINSFIDESKNSLSESHETVDNAKNVYLSQVELAAAVTYWSEKKDIHGTSKKIGLGVLVLLLLLTASSPLLVSKIVSKIDLPNTALIFELINPLTLITSVLVISLLSFTLRLSSKHYSTQQHLYLEAEERKTMLKTYLALMNEGKLVEQEDRKVALDALFRPAQTGMVADAGNIVPTDSIIRIVEKQSTQARPQ